MRTLYLNAIAVIAAINMQTGAVAMETVKPALALQAGQSWCDNQAVTFSVNQIVALAPGDDWRKIDLKAGQSVIVDLVARGTMDTIQSEPLPDAEYAAAADAAFDATADFTFFTEIKPLALQICRLSDGKIVFPSRQSVFASMNDAIGLSEGARGTIMPTEDGSYVIKAIGIGETDYGGYSLAELFVRERDLKPELPVTQLDTDQNRKDDRWEVQRKPDASATADIYSFEAQVGQIVEVSLVSASDDYDPFLQIAPPDASFSDIMTSDDYGGTVNSRYRFTVKKPGRYEIKATSGFSSFGPYRLSLKKEQAKPLNIPRLETGKPLPHTLSEDSDAQFISANLRANKRYVLNIAPVSKDTDGYGIIVEFGTPASLEVVGPGEKIFQTDESSLESQISWRHSAAIMLEQSISFEVRSPLQTTLYVRLKALGAVGDLTVTLAEK